MFEQSILTAQPTKRSWFLAVSFVAQTGLILLAGLIPLIYTDQLPGLAKWAQQLVAPSPPPAAPPQPETPAPSRRPVRTPGVFTAPRSVPSQIAEIHDLQDRPLVPDTIEVLGVTGPPGVGSAINQLLTSMGPPPKPPEPPAPPRPALREPLRVRQGVQEAKLLRKVLPIYPPLAIATRTQGTVRLVGVIAKDGSIRDLQVIEGHPLLVRAALDAVKQWVYKPTLLSGEPVEVVAPISVTFTLNH